VSGWRDPEMADVLFAAQALDGCAMTRIAMTIDGLHMPAGEGIAAPRRPFPCTQKWLSRARESGVP